MGGKNGSQWPVLTTQSHLSRARDPTEHLSLSGNLRQVAACGSSQFSVVGSSTDYQAKANGRLLPVPLGSSIGQVLLSGAVGGGGGGEMASRPEHSLGKADFPGALRNPKLHQVRSGC